MTRAIDSFWIELQLHHPFCDPAEISKALGIAPSFSAKAGQVLGSVTRKSTLWFATLRQGVGDEKFGEALEDVLILWDKARDFFTRHQATGGEVELVLNQAVGIDDGVLFRLRLEPSFLESCGNRGIRLRVQAWSAELESAAV